MEQLVSIPLQKRPTVTLCNHNFSKEGDYHPDRIMEEFDLLYMVNGEWDITEEDSTYHLAPHSILLLVPGKHHFSVERSSPMMRNVYVHFTLPADDDYNDTGFSLAIPKLTDCSAHRDILHLMERIIENFFTEREDKELRCSLLLEQLLLFLSELGEANRKDTDVLVNEIIHRFHTATERFLSPDELAKDYGVSVRTVSGRFKTVTGMSIHQYQLRLKLNMAYDMLPASPGRSLRDVATGYGFYDEFQFSRLFKRQFGISPSERR